MGINKRNFVLQAGFVAALLFCILFFWVCPVSAGEIKNNADYKYRYLEEDKGIEILKYKGTEERVTVPETIDGKPVKVIGWYAFNKKWTESNERLKEVRLPNTVTSIRGGAFRECVNLERIELPKKLKNIGEGAFARCKSLQEIELPETLTVISKYLFSDSGLKKITIPKNVRRIESGAFGMCRELEKVTFPKGSSLERLGDSAFEQCHSLTQIRLPDSLSVIEGGAFIWCVNLKEVSAGKRSALKGIGGMAFFECIRLEKVMIPKKVKSMGDYVFLGCESLKRIDFLGSVPQMGKSIFKGIDRNAVFCVPSKYKKEYRAKLKKYAWFQSTMKVRGVK